MIWQNENWLAFMKHDKQYKETTEYADFEYTEADSLWGKKDLIIEICKLGVLFVRRPIVQFLLSFVFGPKYC